MAKYEVDVFYRGKDTFIVEANTEEEAAEAAELAFKSGDAPSPTGNEWEEFENVGDINEIDEEGGSPT